MLPMLDSRLVTVAMGYTKRKDGKWIFRWTEHGIRKTKYIGDETALRKWKKKQEAKPGEAHVAHNSGNNEWHTPPEFIAAARKVMGAIDLDPASSNLANRMVGAAAYFTAEADGLKHPWSGKVWLNPPYAVELIGKFCAKLLQHIDHKEVTEAIVLVNNATETNWFQRMLVESKAVCFVRQRVRFLDTEGNPGAPLQGQAILYMGTNKEAFARAFVQFGVILYG